MERVQGVRANCVLYLDPNTNFTYFRDRADNDFSHYFRCSENLCRGRVIWRMGAENEIEQRHNHNHLADLEKISVLRFKEVLRNRAANEYIQRFSQELGPAERPFYGGILGEQRHKVLYFISPTVQHYVRTSENAIKLHMDATFSVVPRAGGAIQLFIVHFLKDHSVIEEIQDVSRFTDDLERFILDAHPDWRGVPENEGVEANLDLECYREIPRTSFTCLSRVFPTTSLHPSRVKGKTHLQQQHQGFLRMVGLFNFAEDSSGCPTGLVILSMYST
ncbi:hypothetical protein FQR65_LT17884 [Abscondita terminalis]|nr:hypothetical protein FQR65_LT17884 [Abscondita terminalis]